MRFPAHPFARALLRRALLLWTGVRLVLFVIQLPSAAGLFPSPSGALLVILTVAALGLLEAHRRNETVFLANLEVGGLSIAALSAFPALVLEILFLAGHRL